MITQSDIDSVHWYHEFDFGNGLHATSKTPDVQAHRKVWEFINRELDAIDFLGKSVLDIGCWDGFWSFYAEKRGASSVFGTDDISQNWSTGKGIHLAKALLGSKIEIDQSISIYDLAKLERKFDIILCLGVYYHLVDPFAAFAQIRHCCTNDSIIVFEGDATIGIRSDTVFQGFRDPHASLYIPTPHALNQLLRAAYLRTERQVWRAPPPPPSLRRRLQYLMGALSGADPTTLAPPSRCERLITICRPMSGENRIHLYKPPFGLAQFDDRFRQAPKKRPA